MALTGTVSDQPRLLVMRALGLGDALTGIPALRALSAANPHLRLTVAQPAGLTPVLELAGLAADVLPTTGLYDEPPRGPVALAVNLHGKGPRSHRWLRAAHPQQLVAFDCPDAGVTGPDWRPDEHERARWCRLVTEGLGVPADPDDLRLVVRHRGGSGAALLHPGAAAVSRRWPVDRFVVVARRLQENGLRVLVTGSPDERPLARAVADHAGLPVTSVLAGRTGIPDLADRLATAEVLVSGDTGVAHLAAAVGTPSVTLFGPVPPDEWGPPAGPHRALWSGRRGDPHGADPDPGLLALHPDDVMGAVGELLEATRPLHRSP